MMNYIVFALALLSVQSVYSRSSGVADDIRTDNYQSYKLVNDPKSDVDQPRGTSILEEVRNVEISGATQQLLLMV